MIQIGSMKEINQRVPYPSFEATPLDPTNSSACSLPIATERQHIIQLLRVATQCLLTPTISLTALHTLSSNLQCIAQQATTNQLVELNPLCTARILCLELQTASQCTATATQGCECIDDSVQGHVCRHFAVIDDESDTA